MTNDELAARMDQQFSRIDEKFAAIDKRFDAIETKVDDGFNASKARDEELRDLMKFGLEAREILREEIHRRFDDTDRKHDEQITLLKDTDRKHDQQIALLKDTVRHLNSHR